VNDGDVAPSDVDVTDSGQPGCALVGSVWKNEDYTGSDHTTNDEHEVLDAYIPAGEAPGAGWPTIIVFVGGGFTSSNKSEVDPCTEDTIGHQIMSKGWALVVAEYRILEHKWPLPEEDGPRVVQWVRHRASTWGIKTDAIVGFGKSASAIVGLYAALGAERAATDPEAPAWEHQSSRLQAFVNHMAATDWTIIDDTFQAAHFATGAQMKDIPKQTVLDASATWYGFQGETAELNRAMPIFSLYGGEEGTPPLGDDEKVQHNALFGRVLHDTLEAHDDFHKSHSCYHQDLNKVETLFDKVALALACIDSQQCPPCHDASDYSPRGFGGMHCGRNHDHTPIHKDRDDVVAPGGSGDGLRMPTAC
jgi:hypothetical protein